MTPSNALLIVYMNQAYSPFSPSEGASSHGRALEESVTLFGKPPQDWAMETKPTNEVPRIVELTPRNYGALPSGSTVKLGEKRL
jgi:hypothetical protein